MKNSLAIVASVFICVFLSGFGAKGSVSQADKSVAGTQSLVVDRSFGKMPLYFIRNEGQMDPRVGYYIQGKDKIIYFTSEGLTYVLSKRVAAKDGNKEAAGMEDSRPLIPPERKNLAPEAQSRWVVKLDFVGANPNVRPSGEEKTEAIISYFRGKKEEWKTGLPTYSKVIYRELWPGIDLVYYGTVDRLKYEFIVHPGVDPSRIQLAYRGAEAVAVNDQGRLEVLTPGGGFEDDVPVAWQEVGGKKTDVALSYELREKTYGFQIGDYDRTQTLVLDPAVLVYCGYIGGSGWESGTAIAVDAAGNAYITGEVSSGQTDFPVTAGPDLTSNGSWDAFVAKVNASGTALSYCGYIGGSEWDQGCGISVDSAGNAYVAGFTYSEWSSFPINIGPDLSFNGSVDAFVAKINSSGTGLYYCGYIGGSAIDAGYAIDIDSSGNAYVTGEVASDEATFPVTAGWDSSYNGGSYDAYVAKVNSSGTALSYCGYIGGSSLDYGNGIAVDSSGNAYVTGSADSDEATFPILSGPDYTYNGAADAFVTKVNSAGTALLYSGYIGGSEMEMGDAIALDPAGNAYVTGWTRSDQTTFPVIVGPDLVFNSSGDLSDAFVAKVNSSGSAVSYCGYIGGSEDDDGLGIAVDDAGNAYVTGSSESGEATFPVKSGPDLSHNGMEDAWVAKVASSGDSLSYCGYVGGSDNDYGTGIALDAAGNAYITGETYSTESTFPVTLGPDLTFNGGQWDAFVAKISSGLKDDVLGTWESTGVWYRNTVTGAWVKLTSPAALVSSGDIDKDGTADLIGVWDTGLWVRYSKTKSWVKLSSSPPLSIASGDLNGDSRDDIVGSWATGVFFRDSKSGMWVSLSSSPASLISAGHVDGDDPEDLIGVWNTGLWVRKSSSGAWTKLSANLPTDIAAGDMNGDGRDDVVGTWASGVWYRNSISGGWVLMSSSAASLVAAGAIDGDGKNDLIGVWDTGLWVKKSATGAWIKLSSALPKDIDAGLFRTGATAYAAGLTEQDLIAAETPGSSGYFEDLSNEGPGGWKFEYDQEDNLVPFELEPKLALGPGDPGFHFESQENLVPREGMGTHKDKEKPAIDKRD